MRSAPTFHLILLIRQINRPTIVAENSTISHPQKLPPSLGDLPPPNPSLSHSPFLHSPPPLFLPKQQKDQIFNFSPKPRSDFYFRFADPTPMASKGGPPAICCMCGDEGLTQELFRCKLCLVRSQHRYCSNQYPNVEFYTLCNWCLREGSNSSKKEAVKEGYSNFNSSNISSSGNNDSNDTGKDNREVDNNNTSTTTNASSSTSSGVKLHRVQFSSQLDNPIKKPRILNRSASDVTDRIRYTGEISPRLGMARQVFKAKVRRYKLLEEVSS